MRKLILCVFSVLSLLVVSTVSAADTKGYFALKGGIFDPNNKTDGLKDFDTGTNFELAYGMKVHQNISLEFGAGYYKAELKEAGDTIKASAVPLTLTALVNIPMGNMGFNIGAGAGYYFTKIEMDLGVVSVSKEKGAVGYQAVAGLDFNLGQAMSIGAEAKYVQVKPDYSDLGGKAEMGGMIYNAVLKFKF